MARSEPGTELPSETDVGVGPEPGPASDAELEPESGVGAGAGAGEEIDRAQSAKAESPVAADLYRFHGHGIKRFVAANRL